MQVRVLYSRDLLRASSIAAAAAAAAAAENQTSSFQSVVSRNGRVSIDSEAALAIAGSEFAPGRSSPIIARSGMLLESRVRSSRGKHLNLLSERLPSAAFFDAVLACLEAPFPIPISISNLSKHVFECINV